MRTDTPFARRAPTRLRQVDQLKDYLEWNARGFRDFYAKHVEVKDVYLGSYTLAPGTHTLRFESVGHNPLSLGDALGWTPFGFDDDGTRNENPSDPHDREDARDVHEREITPA